MGSQQNDSASYQPSEPKPCANNCGFFGSAATMNLCSKCYRDFQVKDEQAASAKAAMEKSFDLRPLSTHLNSASSSSAQAQFLLGSSSSSSSPSSSSSQSSSANLGADQGQPKSNRCLTCNRKVGLTGFKCKCESTFCGTHRYPEKHDCTYDFKVAGRDAIAKANPAIKAPKLNRF